MFLILAFFITHEFVITPTLIVLLLFANEFVTMSIAADHATPSPTPDRWQVRQLVGSALALAAVLLVELFLLLWLMLAVFHQELSKIQTLMFLMLVFSGQTTVYVVRERGHFWSSLPGRTLLVASLCNLLVVSGLAALGILMTHVSPLLIGVTFALALTFMLLLDLVKRWVVLRPDPLARTR